MKKSWNDALGDALLQKILDAINPYLGYANRWRKALDDVDALTNALFSLTHGCGSGFGQLSPSDPDFTSAYLFMAQSFGWDTPTQAQIDDFNDLATRMLAAKDSLPIAFKLLQDFTGAAAQVTTLLHSSSPTEDTIQVLGNELSLLEAEQSAVTDYPSLIQQSISNINAESDSLLNASSMPTTSGAIYYDYKVDNLDIRGKSGDSASMSVFLPANSIVELSVYQPRTGLVGHTSFVTGPSGSSGSQGALILIPSQAPDSIGDGFPDDAREVLGLSFTNPDPNGDGIDDMVEIQEGLDPFSVGVFPTGVVANLQLNGEAQKVVLQGSALDPQGQIAYVATGSYGLAIVDASQLQKPIIVGQLAFAGDAVDVSVDSNLQIAAVADSGSGLRIVDVSNPMSPVLLRTINVPATQVQVVDGVAYVPVGSSVEAFDLLTGQNLQTLPLLGSTIIAMAREGTMLYTEDSSNTVRAVDISGFQMVGRGSLTLTHGGGQLFVGNGIAYVSVQPFLQNRAFVSGYETVNVSDPNNFRLLGGAGNLTLAGNAVVANGSGLVVTVGSDASGGPAVDVLDGSDPTNTNNFLTRFALPVSANDVAIGAGIAFVADGSSGLQVVNYVPFDTAGIAPTVSISAPGADVDPSTDGIQVVAGTSVPLRVNLSDDVQVRNVELLVNGQVVSNEVSFPFDFSVLAVDPSGNNTVTVQVRATDTGGNTTLSNVVTLNLIPDTIAPSILGVDPFDGATRREGLQTIRIRFSEPLAAGTVNADNFQFMDSSGALITPEVVTLAASDRLVTLTFAPLIAGNYQLVIHAANVTDRAGNTLGSSDIVTSFAIVSATIAWINPNGGNWDEPTNWDTGVVPGSSDQVAISTEGNATVTYRQGSTTVQSIVSTVPLSLTGGTINVASTVEVDSTFTVNGGTLSGGTVLRGKDGEGIALIGPHGGSLSNLLLEADLLVDGTSGTLRGCSKSPASLKQGHGKEAIPHRLNRRAMEARRTVSARG